MTDRELETRLRTHLRRRFDGAQPPPELLASVQQVISTPRRRIGMPSLRVGAFRPGWPAVAGLIVIALVVVAGIQIAPQILGPAADPSPSPASADERFFIVLPPVDATPTKTESSFASDVLNARLRSLFFVGDDPVAFTSAVGNAITFRLPPTGPSDATIGEVLRAQGQVAFVPLPASYTDGTNTAEIGQNMPTDEPVLFGWDGLAAAATEVDEQGQPILTITLRPAAASAFGDSTASNAGGSVAVVIDDDVALLLSITEAMPDGRIQVPAGAMPGDAFAYAAAVLVGGKLPDAWSSLPPIVPELRQPEELAAGLARELPEVTVESADLDAIFHGGGWVAIWRTHLGGRIAEDTCPQLSVAWQGNCPLPDPATTFIFDAETGDFLSTEPS